MSSRYRQREPSSDPQNQAWRLAMPLIEAALSAHVVALVGVELDGAMFILPTSPHALECLRILRDADWPAMVRIAEEMQE